MDTLTALTDLYTIWANVDKWLLITCFILGFNLLRIIARHLHKAGLYSFHFLEKYRDYMNRREHNQKNIEMIDELKSEKMCIRDRFYPVESVFIKV